MNNAEGSEYVFSFKPPEPSGQVIETASWRLAAEIVRRYPGRFSVIERHPGGGQSECINLSDQDEDSSLRSIDLNRAGSVWVHKRDESDWIWRGSWLEMIAAEQPRLLVDRLCQKSGLPAVNHPPSATREVVTYRVISAFLLHAVFGRTRWECRNGYSDTSGYGGGPRKEYFENFPAAATRLRVREAGDMPGESAYHFWFLLRNGEPSIAIEAAHGTAWDSHGRTIDLFAEYSVHRRIWPAVLKMAGRRMP